MLYGQSHHEVYQFKHYLTPQIIRSRYCLIGSGYRAIFLSRTWYLKQGGGIAEPIKGASNNGMSNFFPRYSPDGNWIVYCQAKSFIMVRPDSKLHIIPAGGGESRRLKCNNQEMNSWHSWSPNSKWLVLASKRHSPMIQLFLTHIDDRG